jgi:hypothetical protein
MIKLVLAYTPQTQLWTSKPIPLQCFIVPLSSGTDLDLGQQVNSLSGRTETPQALDLVG